MANEPALLLAKTWEGQSLIGWHLSEKLDGVRALWDGHKFVTRLGNTYNAPEWFTKDFPDVQLDGELWMGRGKFSELVGAVKRNVPIDAQWEKIRYLVFDVLYLPYDTFETRIKLYTQLATESKYIEAVPQVVCESDEMLKLYLDSVIAGGGEGLMARQPGSMYVGKRSSSLLKIKRMQDCEATVYGYQDGKGKHAGRMGALLCQLDSGAKFKVGTGFDDRQRENPPCIGSRITVRFQELSATGVPRFPAFVAVRNYE